MPLSQEEIQKYRDQYKLGTPELDATVEEAPKEPGFFSRVKTDFMERGKKVQASIDENVRIGESDASIFEKEKALGQSGFNIAGQFAGGAMDIIGEGIKSIIPDIAKKGLEQLSNKIADVVTENPRVLAGLEAMNGGIDKYQEWKTYNPEDAKSLEGAVNIASLLVGGRAKTPAVNAAGVAEKTIAPVLEGTSGFGSKIKYFGEKLYKSGITPTAREAELIQKYEAGQGSLLDDLIGNGDDIATNNPTFKPVLRADTALEKGIAGTERMIGRQAERTANNLWKDVLEPALKESKGMVSKDDIFAPAEARILAEVEPMRKAAFKNALEAIKEDYKSLPDMIPDLQAQKIKSSLDNFTPSKIFKGQEVASEVNTLKNDMANGIRAKIYENLEDINIKKQYRDYGNLAELKKIGVKAISEGGKKGGFGSFVSSLWDEATTPIKTIGGKVLYKVGNKIQFIGDKGINTFGEFMESNGYRKPTPIKLEVKSEGGANEVKFSNDFRVTDEIQMGKTPKPKDPGSGLPIIK